MKRKEQAPPQPTVREKKDLSAHIIMEDWHFTCTIKIKCTEVYSHCISWDGESKQWTKATVFGLQAIRTATKEPCIANFFIRYGARVYQAWTLEKLTTLIDLIKKEADFKACRHKIDDAKWKERQHQFKLVQAAKAKVKKMKPGQKKKALEKAA
jgi:hypothetical protein